MDNKFNPLVSIVIPVFNGSNYLREAIDSALGQTYKSIEVIVVNDGSNDGGKTREIVLSYGGRVRYFEKENGGVASALNEGLKEMNGEYFSWLSHDDMYYPSKVEKQISFLKGKKNKGNIIVYSDYELINEKSKVIRKKKLNHMLLTKKPLYSLLRGCVHGCSLLIPRLAFDKCGFFDENLKTTQDYELWFIMIKHFSFIHIPEILVKSRWHKEQGSKQMSEQITEGDRLWIKMMDGVSKKEMEELEGNESKYYHEMSLFLKKTPFQIAKQYANQRQKESIENIKVSVIIPFYNRVAWTIEAVNSVINQTHKNIEIVLINDGSTEDISSIMELNKGEKRLHLIEIDHSGVSKARNVGINYATGKYIAFLDSDDLFESNKIEHQLDYMELNNASFSHTSYKRVGNKSSKIIESGCFTGRAFPKIIYHCPIATPTVMIKKEIIKSREAFQNRMIACEDICLWIDLLKDNILYGINKALTIVRVGKESAAFNVDSKILGMNNVLDHLKKDKKLLNQYPLQFARLYRSLYYLCLQKGHKNHLLFCIKEKIINILHEKFKIRY